MRALPVRVLLAFLLAYPLVACKKPQVAASATPLSNLAKRAVIESRSSIAETPTHFTREVRRGEEFQQSVAPNMIFRLEPYAGNDSGWTIRLTPGTDAKAISMDCIGAVSEPLHGNTNLSIDPPEADGLSGKAAKWKPREFDFVPDAANCKVAWDLMNSVYYPSKLSDEQRTEAGEKLGRIPTAHGKFAIIDSRLGPPANATEPPVIEWLKFEVELNIPVAPQTASAEPQN